MMKTTTTARRGTLLAFVSLGLCAAFGASAAGGREIKVSSLKELSLEELMDLQVTSVSRTEESLAGAAAAISVVTSEDIRRSGATTVPEALRFVPGMHVARRTSSSWAVSSRGFSSVNSEKLLVLSDTRSIYTPLYSGVFWDVQDYLLEDVDRIEVIGGPGAALWGSNAVNGVINITTKRAQDTQGPYTEAIVGTEEQSVSARYGGQTPSGGISYRVFGRYFDRDGSFNPNNPNDDDWRMSHVGFRSDGEVSTADTWTVQGDVYRANVGQLAPSVAITGRAGPQGKLEAELSGGNVLGRWRHTVSDSSDLQLRAYYDRTHRDDPAFRDDLETVDVDFQHRFAPTTQQELIWGLNYRHTDNRNVGKVIFNLDPRSSADNIVSAFVQDQVAFADSLRLTLGTKFEYNDFSGFEYQPSVRLAWQVSPQQMVWAAVSRAVRVPTRLERDIAIDVSSNPAANPIQRLLGNDDFDSEKLLAYEAGYRWQGTDRFAVDLTAFHNVYDGLASLELGQRFVAANGRTVIPIVNKNLNDGDADGAGLLATFVPRKFLRLVASYSYVNVRIDRGGLDLNGGRFIAGATPRHQFGLRSLLDIAPSWQLDLQLRHDTPIRSGPGSGTGAAIEAYTEMDLRGAWQLSNTIEVALVGQNLLHDHHAEFGTPQARGEIERSVYGKMTWGF
jgi:iron complex outermembrane receptor protein